MNVGWNEWGGGTLLAVENENWLAEIALVPGGCPVRLLEKRTATEVFRTPANMAALRKEPAVYGMPVLLPPNRIAGGRFQAAGREYRLPVNEPEKGNHLHGLLLNRPWQLERETPDGVILLCRFGEDQPEYAGFPHTFEARRSFEFLPGLFRHRFELVNRSEAAMPFGLGFHTAFRLPEVEEAFVEIPFREEGGWAVHPERRLPTGELRPWSGEELALFRGERPAGKGAVAAMFPLPPGAAGHRAELRWNGRRIVYEFDLQYRHLACWNGGGGAGFFCIEPMSWMTDAPNVDLAPEISGFRLLAPGERTCFVSTIAVKLPR